MQAVPRDWKAMAVSFKGGLRGEGNGQNNNKG